MQKINFLKGLPKSQNQLTVRLMNWIVSGFCIVLIGISLLFTALQLRLQHGLESDLAILTDVSNNYNQILHDYPLLASEIPVGKQVADLQTQYNEQKDKVDSIKQLTVRKGFSKYMFALTQATPDTLWLKEIIIDLANRSFTLNGFAVNPDAVSTLMSQLQQTNAYHLVVFHLFFVKAINNSSYVQFSIATTDLNNGGANQANDLSPNRPKG